MLSGVAWHTTALATALAPNVHTPVAVVVAVALATHVLGCVSEKPAEQEVQMAPAVQTAQLLEQSAHVPAIDGRRDRIVDVKRLIN